VCVGLVVSVIVILFSSSLCKVTWIFRRHCVGFTGLQAKRRMDLPGIGACEWRGGNALALATVARRKRAIPLQRSPFPDGFCDRL
jgi:hypothetical protein